MREIRRARWILCKINKINNLIKNAEYRSEIQFYAKSVFKQLYLPRNILRQSYHIFDSCTLLRLKGLRLAYTFFSAFQSQILRVRYGV